MGKQRLRKWILNNEFFSYQGQFSKSAFIAMSTWALVILKFVFSGLVISAGIAQRTIGNRIIPEIKWTWTITFSAEEAVALLTLVFGLYFGGKFSPNNKNGEGERRDLQGEGK